MRLLRSVVGSGLMLLVSCERVVTGPEIGPVPRSIEATEEAAVAPAPNSVEGAAVFLLQGVVGGLAAPAPAVVVKDQEGRPLAGAQVSWWATGGGTVPAASTPTGEAGVASVPWTLGSKAGPQALTATVGALPPVTFLVNSAAAVPASISVASGDAQSGAAGSALREPLVVAVVDAHGNPVPGAAVSWSAAEGNGSLVISGSTAGLDGHASAVWTLGGRAGIQSVTVAVGSLPAITFSATASNAAPTAASVAGGDQQQGIVGSALRDPLRVWVVDRFGNPVAGAAVTFSAPSDAGSITPATAVTDSSGVASGTWTLGTVAGSFRVTAEVAGATTAFGARALAAPAATLVKVSGDAQVGGNGGVLGQPLLVRAHDRYGNHVRGAAVQWSIVAGEGAIVAADATTDSLGDARATWRLLSVGAHRARATVAGVSATFDATASGTRAGGTIAPGTIWRAGDSPYQLVAPVTIPAGVTLRIEPGVKVEGNGQSLSVTGTLDAQGTSTRRIVFENTHIVARGSFADPQLLVEIAFADLNGGTLFSPERPNHNAYGALRLRDSRITSLGSYVAISGYFSGKGSFIERNVFLRSGGISTSIGGSSVSITNNSFHEWSTDFAVQNSSTMRIDPGSGFTQSATFLQGNSFWDRGRVAVRLSAAGASLDARGNYWGNASETEVPAMIHDGADVSTLSVVPYLPILPASSPDTPTR